MTVWGRAPCMVAVPSTNNKTKVCPQPHILLWQSRAPCPLVTIGPSCGFITSLISVRRITPRPHHHPVSGNLCACHPLVLLIPAPQDPVTWPCDPEVFSYDLCSLTCDTGCDLSLLREASEAMVDTERAAVFLVLGKDRSVPYGWVIIRVFSIRK